MVNREKKGLGDGIAKSNVPWESALNILPTRSQKKISLKQKLFQLLDAVKDDYQSTYFPTNLQPVIPDREECVNIVRKWSRYFRSTQSWVSEEDLSLGPVRALLLHWKVIDDISPDEIWERFPSLLM